MNQISCFLYLFHSSIEVESMSCDLPMNQKEIIASISFYKNKCLIISYYNEQHLFIPRLFEFLHYLLLS